MLFTNWKIGPDLVLLCLLISLKLVTSQTVAPKGCGSEPPISIVNSFEANIEATFSDKKISMLIQEYFQPAATVDDIQLGAVIQASNGKKIQAIFNYTSMELFYIADDICTTVHAIPTFTNVLPDNPNNVVNAFIYSTKDILRIIQDSSCTSQPNTTIRGIDAQHYQNQLEDNSQFKNIIVDVYFTNNWATEDNYRKPVPLRIEFSGEIKASGKPFSHYFDYYYFNYVPVFSFKERENAFEIPPGVYCAGRKHQSPIPVLPLSYSVTIEFVDPVDTSVKISKLWASTQYQMIRRDFHPVSYVDAGHSVTEIYNYLTGTVYTRDNALLNCSYNTLEKANFNDDDILEHLLDVMNGKATHMVDTLKILDLNSDNTFYNGQRILRKVLCDVFISLKTIQTESGASVNVTFEYYFMSDNWKLLPDRGGPSDVRTNIPMALEISYDHKGNVRNYFYNFLDFSDVVSYKDFDTSACYNQTKDIVFKISFKGEYVPSLRNAFEKVVHSQISDNSGIAKYRVQNIHMEYDDHFVFIFGSIIDPAPPETLFTPHENKKIKSKVQRGLMFKKFTMSQCAEECIDYGKCYGFELTADGVCTLTAMKFSEEDSDSQLEDSQGTNFYARTMMKFLKWETNANVWNSLYRNVYHGALSFDLTDPLTKMVYSYKSYNIELLAGDVSNIAIPIFGEQVYYHEEITLPTYEQTSYHDIWYDKARNLMRLDQYVKGQGVMTTIHDYSTGIAYYMDNDLRNCTVLPISNTSVDAVMQKVGNTSVIRMKTAQQFFYADQPFKSVGQKTVRGILCDVYETVRNDYIVPGRSTPSESTIIYYIANEQESEVTSEENQVQSEPIMLEIISESVSYYAVHNFFDFNNNAISWDTFNIKDCYEVTNDMMFQIVFQGDSVELAKNIPDEFIQEAQVLIVKITSVELLRIQKSIVEYDDKYVYFTANLISYPTIKGDVKVTKPPVETSAAVKKLKNYVIGGYVSVNLTSGSTTVLYKAISMRDDVRSTDTNMLQMERNLRKFSLYKRDTSIIESKALETFLKMSVDDCASICLSLEGKCKGFGFCMNQGYCYLAVEHPDTHASNLKSQKGCFVYNRDYINGYNKKPGKSMVLTGTKSVDAENEVDCAKQCTLNNDFRCESFEYCPNLQECTLSKVHTMNIPDDQISFMPDCDIYSREFLAEFHVTRKQTVKMVNNEIFSDTSLEECAKVCMEMERYSCSSFDYCKSSHECRLVYKDVENTGQVSFEKSAECDHYTRIQGTYYVPNTSSAETESKKGDFVKVFFILLFCGIMIGVVFMFIYIRRKNRIGL